MLSLTFNDNPVPFTWQHKFTISRELIQLKIPFQDIIHFDMHKCTYTCGFNYTNAFCEYRERVVFV